jgi:hypothetical protein
MLQVMKDIGGVELPESLIRFTGESPAARIDEPADEPVKPK